MDFFMNMVAKRVGPDSALRKVGALIDWQRLVAARSQFMGRRAVESETALKAMVPTLLKAASRIDLVAA